MTEKLTNIVAMALFGIILIVVDVFTTPTWPIILLGALLLGTAALMYFMDKKGVKPALVKVDECPCCCEEKPVAKKTAKKTTTKKTTTAKKK